ncbi:MAG: TIGR03905 family TSCPD domain-containing protein [Clostridia bacterium]|nr:TIGR03905 family TSCPD domain-containing protein [Clostridia bacterium]
MEYKTSGTCSRAVRVEMEDGIITDCSFVGGCSGNTQGVATLVKGMSAEEAVRRLKGIKCGFRPTSCPDQLARAIEALAAEN